ncbi:stage II sporulation protein [Richelia sinica FACHB-800]|uniref:Anti-sigma factor antagonist n=1 Tax=Richelia sinica FACHB-800 TaxID=1357546 RepID=A0A975T754_9NOST|nr:STAS domain-containing protein [Richelia sinica]MBD2666012.1 STAS domain-containing protein [Richelia sinica FACHB-800]QXE23305.1 stage II sporulation protein [Richelia sinica FACHB-800]
MDLQMKIIRPQGILNSKSGSQLLAEIDELIGSDVKTILIDFQDVNFMDSSGFSTLLIMLKTLKKHNMRLVLCSINEQIRMVFEMTNSSQIFEVLPNPTSFISTYNQEEVENGVMG